MSSFCSHKNNDRERTAVATLMHDLQDMGRAGFAFAVRCLRCRHKAVLLPIGLAMKLGTAFPIDRVRARLVCSKCGARGPWIDVDRVTR
jgi:hypothetical protein